LAKKQLAENAYIASTYLGDILMGDLTKFLTLIKKIDRMSKLGNAISGRIPIGHPLHQRILTSRFDWEDEAEAYFKEHNISV